MRTTLFSEGGSLVDIEVACGEERRVQIGEGDLVVFPQQGLSLWTEEGVWVDAFGCWTAAHWAECAARPDAWSPI